jgi:hypothetical protein
MSLRLRSDGKRHHVSKGQPSMGPMSGLDNSGRPGEFRLNMSQMAAIDALYHSHPAIASARTILHGQLLSGGISVARDGTEVNLKPAFKRHLDEVWLSFAGDVIDSFLKHGLVVVVFDEDEDSLIRQSIKRRRNGSVKSEESEPRLLVPLVPSLDTYDIAFMRTGNNGYRRKYIVHATAPNQAARVDEDAIVVIRDHPDPAGNVNSPMAQVFDLGTFGSALTELALQAEVTNARPRLWTQQRRKENNSAAVDTSSLFFDAESRNMQNGQDAEDNAGQLSQLSMQSQLTKMINKLQTTSNGPDHNMNSFSGGGAAASGPRTHVPPEVSPSIFTLPTGQEIAPSAGNMPQARGDLESLQRLVMEQFCSAFGVPADLVFSGRYASKSTAQLSLLNSTVAQLAKSVGRVLTMSYRHIYGEESDAEDPTQLSLITSPLSSTEEVIAVFGAGLAPLEVALPATMHAIGASKDEIDAALKDAIKERDESKLGETKDKEFGKTEKTQQLDLARTREGAEVDRVKAETAHRQKETSLLGREKEKEEEKGDKEDDKEEDEEGDKEKDDKKEKKKKKADSDDDEKKKKQKSA